MIRRHLIALLALGLTACAMQQEEPIMEPIIEEEIAREGDFDCEFGDEDGIGGTGCEPVARKHPGM